LHPSALKAFFLQQFRCIIFQQCCLLGRHAGIRANAAFWADTLEFRANAAFWADTLEFASMLPPGQTRRIFSAMLPSGQTSRNSSATLPSGQNAGETPYFFFQAIAWFIFQAFAWFISSVVLCLSAFHCRRAQNPTAKDAVTPGIQSTPKWHRQHQH
jgi:hypothetical protein